MKKIDKNVYDADSPAVAAAEKRRAIATAAETEARKKRLQVEADLKKLV